MVAYFSLESWVTVPTNSTITIHKQTVMVHPIIDRYYNHNPYHRRSSSLVQAKGLMTNEKASADLGTGVSGTFSADLKRGPLTPSLRDSLATTLTPSMHDRSLGSPATTPGEQRLPTRQDKPTSPTSSVDGRHLATLPVNRDTSKPQEQGNTKKKRRSLSNYQSNPHEDSEDIAGPPEASRSAAYGDPLKIAQYFPELN